MKKEILCSICGHDRAWHNYPQPMRDHNFTLPAPAHFTLPAAAAQETKPMEATTPDHSAPPKKKLTPRRPCSVCGRRGHQGQGAPKDHEYEPMSEAAAAAREAKLISPTAAEEKPKRGRPRKNAKRLTQKRHQTLKVEDDPVALAVASAMRCADLQRQLDAATAELRELLA